MPAVAGASSGSSRECLPLDWNQNCRGSGSSSRNGAGRPLVVTRVRDDVRDGRSNGRHSRMSALYASAIEDLGSATRLSAVHRLEPLFVVDMKAVVREADRLDCRFRGVRRIVGEQDVENAAPRRGPAPARSRRWLGLARRSVTWCQDSTGSSCHMSAGACNTCWVRDASGSVTGSAASDLAGTGSGSSHVTVYSRYSSSSSAKVSSPPYSTA